MGTVFELLKVYWDEVRKAFPEAWGISASKSRLMQASVSNNGCAYGPSVGSGFSEGS